MTTALNIIEGAARLIGVLNKGENLPADDAADGLVSLNDLLSSWSNDSLLCYVRTEESFPLVGGTNSYTIGVGQTFNTIKPIKILEAQIRDSGGIDYPVLVIGDEEYQNIALKSQQEPYPQYLNYNNGHPYGTISLYGTPSTNYTIRLLSEKALTSFPQTSTAVDLPSGWNRALRFNLAIEMAPEFGSKVDPLVVMGAKESKGYIKTAVLKNRPILAPIQHARRPNILGGDF